MILSKKYELHAGELLEIKYLPYTLTFTVHFGRCFCILKIKIFSNNYAILFTGGDDMRSFYILTSALDFIENNLLEPITLDDIAAACNFSLSGLHAMFRYAFGYSLKGYLTGRRLSHAAYDLVNTDFPIIETALKYQYNSHETFTRSFVKFYGETPSAYRKSHRFSQLFPKLNYEGGDTKMKKVDISDLYLELRSKADSYVICADIIRFTELNHTYGFPAGDIALAKTAKRFEDCTTDNMIVFRIGGDEFAVVTGLYSLDEVKQLEEKITSLNGQTIKVDEYEIPLSLRTAIIQIPQSLNYNALFADMHNSIKNARNQD